MKPFQLLLTTMLIGACTDSTEPLPDNEEQGWGGAPATSAPFDPGAEADPLGTDSACASASVQATVGSKPVDILVVIDNSDSMQGEIEEVQNQINVNFANILAQSGVDYRVVMLSSHGTASVDRSICVSAPLGATSCAPVPDAPVNNLPIFAHYDSTVGSHDALCRLMDDFTDPHGSKPGYQLLLRPQAFKTVLVITDDDSRCDGYDNYGYGSYDNYGEPPSVAEAEAIASKFDADLTALSPTHFGTTQQRNYVFHSIVAMAAKDTGDPGVSHLPSDPIVTDLCPDGAVGPGTAYQALSVLTGGLRHHSCALDYTTVFQSIATNVIEGSKVPCRIEIPAPPDGETIALASLLTRYTPGDGSNAVEMQQVPSAHDCAADSFYVDGDFIQLCQAACSLVEQDPGGQLEVLYGCAGVANSPARRPDLRPETCMIDTLTAPMNILQYSSVSAALLGGALLGSAACVLTVADLREPGDGAPSGGGGASTTTGAGGTASSGSGAGGATSTGAGGVGAATTSGSGAGGGGGGCPGPSSAFCDQPGLVACYEFEGDALDGSGNCNHLSASQVGYRPGRVLPTGSGSGGGGSGGAGGGTAGAGGGGGAASLGQAIELNAASGVSAVGTPFALSAFTIETWVYLDVPGQDSQLMSGVGYALEVEPTRFGCSGGAILVAGSTPPVGTWFHLACSSDGSTMVLYLDGQPIGSKNSGVPGGSGGIVTIGNIPAGTKPLDGALDQFRLFDQARTQQEICEAAGGDC